MIQVVDASAVAALVFAEPRAEEVAEQLVAAELVAPTLLGYEVASVCLKKVIRYPEQRELLLQAFASLSLLGIREIDVERSVELVELAEEQRLTIYDASYLWLARTLEAELVTLDTRLLAVWRTYGASENRR